MKVINYKQVAIEYANNCLGDVIPSCIYVKQACQRFINDLNSSNYIYRENKVSEVVKFLNNLELINTEVVKPFNPEPWQIFIIANIYGFYLSDNQDERKYRYAYIEIPRKNGKSFFINALAYYHFINDNYASVLVNANSREQAKEIDLQILKEFSKQLDPDAEQIVNYYNSITYENSKINVLSGNIKALDGYNPSIIIIDEYHSATSMDSYNVMKSGLGARENPLMFIITTAGFDLNSPCYDLRYYYTTVLSGDNEDDSSFGIIYTLDEGEAITDAQAVAKANPNLGISVTKRFFDDEIKKATNNPAELAGIEVKNFNIWQKSKQEDVWIEEKYLKNSYIKDLNINTFTNLSIIIGFDLGSVDDLTAVSRMIIKDDIYYFTTNYYLPQDSIGTKENKMLYNAWHSQGYLTLTPGNVTDYDYVINDIIKWRSNDQLIQSLHYDSHNSTQMAVTLTQQGFYLKPFSQTVGNFNAPTKEFKRLIMSNKVKIEYNPITQWMLSNAILKTDLINGNQKPIKSKDTKKIDGVISMLMALGGYLQNPQVQMNVF